MRAVMARADAYKCPSTRNFERIVLEYECPKCRSDELVDANPTNYAALYYCSTCNHPFDPPEWPCPNCKDTTSVSRNTHDDPFSYYCYKCDMAFNRLDPAFKRKIVSAPAGAPVNLGPAQPSFAVETYSEPGTGTHKHGLTLRNVGPTTVRTRGPRHIAIQYRVTNNRWWTIYGNPDRFRSAQQIHLQPKQTLDWSLEIGPRSISARTFEISPQPKQTLNRSPGVGPRNTSGELFEVNRDAFPSGQYRVVYWGLPDADVLPAVKIPVEFDDTLHGW
jgi:hypothetical protein